MSRNKKPRKAHRPAWNGDGIKVRAEPWRCASIFDPLDHILTSMETDGCTDATPDGVPIFQARGEQTWYQLCPSLEGVIGFYEIHSKRQRRQVPLRPLQVFKAKLEHCMPLAEGDLAALRDAIPTLRAEAMQMTVAYARDLVKTFQLRDAMDTAQIPTSPSA